MRKTLRPLLVSLCVLVPAAFAHAATPVENWENLCAKCHAADGSGNTAIGKKRKIKDYTDAKALAGISNEELTKAIIQGVFKDGKELMKAYKDELSEADAKALVEFIHKMAKH